MKDYSVDLQRLQVYREQQKALNDLLEADPDNTTIIGNQTVTDISLVLFTVSVLLLSRHAARYRPTGQVRSKGHLRFFIIEIPFLSVVIVIYPSLHEPDIYVLVT